MTLEFVLRKSLNYHMEVFTLSVNTTVLGNTNSSRIRLFTIQDKFNDVYSSDVYVGIQSWCTMYVYLPFNFQMNKHFYFDLSKIQTMGNCHSI